MNVIGAWSHQIAAGVAVTLEVAFLSLAFGLLCGLLGAAAKLGPFRFLRWAGDGYTTIIRGTPELLIIFIVYFGGTVGLTNLVKFIDPSARYVEVPALLAGVFALGLIFGGYAAEIFRGALLAIPIGQIEAAKAIGMSNWQIFVSVKLPQMVRYALPGLGNIWISLVKDTALVSVVGLEELMRVTNIATTVTHDAFSFAAVAALIYLLLTFFSTWILERLEMRANRGVAHHEL